MIADNGPLPDVDIFGLVEAGADVDGRTGTKADTGTAKEAAAKEMGGNVAEAPKGANLEVEVVVVETNGNFLDHLRPR